MSGLGVLPFRHALLLLGQLVAVCMVVCVAGRAQQLEPKLSFVQLREGAEIIESIRADLDGDDRTDLLLAWTTEESNERFVQWHLQRSSNPSFRGEPERPALRLDRAVLAIGFGDVHADVGAELIVFTSSVVWAVHFDAAGEAKYEQLLKTQFLWQGVESSEVFGWQQGVRDIDGDGLVDVLVPEPNGYRIALQRRDETGVAKFDRQFLLALPPVAAKKLAQSFGQDRRDERDGRRFEFSFNDGEQGPMLKVIDKVPVPKLGDWDADGDLDLLCVHDGRLLVWLQSTGDTLTQSFAGVADLSLELPRERGRVDTTWRVMAVDVDHDQRVDIAIHSSRMVEEETRVAIEIYRNPGGDPFGGKKRADDKIRMKGLVGLAQYEDIDGDGLPEFVIGTMDLSLMDVVSGGALRGVLNVFKNDFDQKRARFRRPVALAHNVDVPTENAGERGNFKSRFFADVTGDGVCDLLQRTEQESVSIYQLKRSGRGFELGKVVYKLNIDSNADVETVALSQRKEFFVLESGQVIHVRFP